MKRRISLRTHWVLIKGLRVFWIVVVLWCESGAFHWSLLDCRWPDSTLTSSPLLPSTHVLIVADPQVLDDNSYPGRSRWLMSLTRYIVDFNLRKSWDAVLAKLDPHVVVFLGDMMDNGRASMDDDEYSRYYQRFQSIFRPGPFVPVYYLPGNHDVGLGNGLHHSPHARERYQRYFGALNQRFDISSHTFIFLDAPGLVDDSNGHPAGEIHGGQSTAFLHDLAKQPSNGPVILFSHIPLSRPDNSPCGPLREKGTIRSGIGPGYQNLLRQETSDFILERLRPIVVFSGDDHDYCEYMHTLPDGSKVREVTVKSISMAMGIQRPGFQLLSLSPVSFTDKFTPHSSHVTAADKRCLLPNQLKIYTHLYAPLAGLTLLFILFLSCRNRRHRFAKGNLQPEMAVYSESSTVRSVAVLPTSRHEVSPLTPSTLKNDHHSLRIDGDEKLYTYRVFPDAADSNVAGVDVHGPLPPDPTHNSRQGYSAACPSCWRSLSSAGSVLLSVIFALACWTDSSHRSWVRRFAWDISQVAWPCLSVYFMMSVWLFWR